MAGDATDVVVVAWGGYGDGGRASGHGGAYLVLCRARIIACFWHLNHIMLPGGEIEQ